MKNYGCYSNQNKKPVKIFSQTSLEIYRIPLKKNVRSKNMAFMGDSFFFYYGIE